LAKNEGIPSFYDRRIILPLIQNKNRAEPSRICTISFLVFI
jgi:hypothetical protein